MMDIEKQVLDLGEDLYLRRWWQSENEQSVQGTWSQTKWTKSVDKKFTEVTCLTVALRSKSKSD